MLIDVIPKLPFINKGESLSFYHDGLGFEMMADYGDYFLMKKDEIEIHFFSYPTIEPSTSDFMIYLRVSQDIDHLYEKTKHLQENENGNLETKIWGQREFSLIDPSGTLLTFGQAV